MLTDPRISASVPSHPLSCKERGQGVRLGGRRHTCTGAGVSGRASALVLLALLAAAAGAQAPEPLVNSVGMKLAPIRAGAYLFAGKHVENVAMFPQPTSFTVTLEKDFYLGVTEVTQEQYQKLMGANPSVFTGPSRPVEKVSWDEAMEFCRRLSELPAEKQAGRVYSLPSERQWQYAARAGSENLFTYGSDDETKVATIAVCRDGYTDARPMATAPVAGKQPNAWGLYDVLGNVWEWCLDQQPLVDAAGNVVAVNLATSSPKDVVSDQGEGRVILGGGWDNDYRMCNLAARYGVYPTRKAGDIGFRVRCTVATP